MRTRIIDRSKVADDRGSDTIQSRIPTRLLAVILGIVGLSVLFASTAFAQGNPEESPSSLALSLVNGNVILTWEAPAADAGSVTGYEVLRRQPVKDPIGEFHTLVGNTGSQETTYTDTSVNAGESYTYRVKALRGSTKSKWSGYARIDLPEAAPRSVTPQPEPSSASLAPTGLSARVAEDGIALTWDAPEADAGSITEYEISRRFRSPGHADSGESLFLTGSTETRWLDSDASTAGSYSYRVRAHRGDESSEWSNAFEVVVNRVETTEIVRVEEPKSIPLPQNAADVLVSNFGQATAAGFFASSEISRMAQSFRTGDDLGGYSIGSVAVKFGDISSQGELQLEVAIRDAIDGEDICTLSPSSEYSAESKNTFSASAGCRLEAQTTYFVVISKQAGFFEWLYTNSENEDVAAPGWSIENRGHVYLSSLDHWQSTGVAFHIEVTRGSVTINDDDEPVLTIVAGDAVEYGTGGNLSNAVAEFTVTRTGSVDEELIFNLSYTEASRTSTAKFYARESTAVLMHFAIDRNEDSDPICSVTFALEPGYGYIVGAPSVATVAVQGPGTTCMDDN